MCLPVAFWNQCFKTFFSLPSQHDPHYMCNMLARMRGKGSYAEPNQYTLQVIENGACYNSEIEDRETVANAIRSAMKQCNLAYLCCGV